MKKQILIGFACVFTITALFLWTINSNAFKSSSHLDLGNYNFPLVNSEEKVLMLKAVDEPEQRQDLGEWRTKKALEILDGDKVDEHMLAHALMYAASGADLAPENARSWMALGMAWMAQKNNRLAYEKAQEAFETAFLLNPEEPAIAYLLGQSLFLQGEYYAARQVWMPVLLQYDDNKMSADIAVQAAQSYILSNTVSQGVKEIRGLQQDRSDNISLLALRSLLEYAQLRHAEQNMSSKNSNQNASAFYERSRADMKKTLEIWERLPQSKQSAATTYYTAMLDDVLNNHGNE